MLASAMLSREVLKDPGSRNHLAHALADILAGIRKEWGLSIQELAHILSLPFGTVKGWLKEGGRVGLDSVLDHNTQAIVDFIDIYNMVASFIVKTEDQARWFRLPSERFENKSPMTLIYENPHNLSLVRNRISHLLNP